MLPPGVKERAAREADWHVQFTISSVEDIGDDARVSGTVVRVFRGPSELLGRACSVAVPIVVPGAEHPPSGIGRKPIALLREARVLEAFINNDGGETRLALGLSMTLDAATDTPQHPILWPLPQRPKSRRPVLRLVVLALLVVPAAYWLVHGCAP